MEDLEEKLEEIRRIREFGKGLGLKFAKSFTRLDTSDYPIYFVCASYKDRLEAVTKGFTPDRNYETFFDKSEAEERAKELEDYDVYFYGVSAYGGLDCPITESLLKENPEKIARMILHEGYHIYLLAMRINLPYKLEEAIAMYIGLEGAIEFYKNNPELHRRACRQKEWWLGKAGFINKYYALLSDCYEKSGDREEIFLRAKEEAARLNIKSYIFNNAYFLRQVDYTMHTDLVFETFKNKSIRKYLKNPKRINKYLIERIE